MTLIADLTGSDWVIVIGAIFLGLGQLLSTILQFLNSLNIRKIEVATNSMKDALVKATGEAATLEGEKTGRALQRAETRADTERLVVAAVPQEVVVVNPLEHPVPTQQVGDR